MTTVDALIMTNGAEDEAFIQLTILGPPVAQPRPRGRIVNHRIVIFNPTTRVMNVFKRSVRLALGGLGVVQWPVLDNESAIKVSVDFFVTNMSKDIDNLVKFVLDGLQGVLYADDRKIVSIKAHKHRSTAEEQRTVLHISAV